MNSILIGTTPSYLKRLNNLCTAPKGVYRVRTRDSVLGETEYAEFVPVKVIETDAQSAAIEATLSDKDQVIVSTSKPINDGDRVRSKK